MMNKIIRQVSPLLPLKIDIVEWVNPSLVLAGEKWAFSTISSWRIVKNNKLICDCRDDNLDKVLKQLINLSIVELEVQASQIAIDPVFTLSNAWLLEIFSVTYLEPWLFTPPFSERKTFVASPGDKIWVENLY